MEAVDQHGASSGAARREEAAAFFRTLQDTICAGLEELDGVARFQEDLWERPEGGGGRTRVLSGGAVFEKAGVAFSEVFGDLHPELALQLPGSGSQFGATGISLVLHPLSPMVPAIHANFRYLVRGDADWFGGGADLTPYYPRREDAIAFHRAWRDVCARHPGVADYGRFKQWCDEYFFLPHRGEMRGIGGIFFDHVEGDWSSRFAFVQDCGATVLKAYGPIVLRRRADRYGPKEKAFQEYRRGRYAEFNLLYDRGTAFGLKTGGRVESILMSLPPVVRWIYGVNPEANSEEAQLADYLRPRDWANEA